MLSSQRGALRALISNSRGLSLIELLVASGLSAMIIGLSVTPLLQIKRIERHVEFQSSMDIAHQIALQKARNGNYLKDIFHLTPGNDVDQCFGGRGKNCTAYSYGQSETPVSIDSFLFQDNTKNISVLSDIAVYLTCTALKCGEIRVTVSTHQEASEKSNAPLSYSRPIVARFSVPASALSSRQEIDFSPCVGKIVTGVDYSTLKAICTDFTGSNTCSGIQSSGPMKTFAQTNNSDPGNCQVPEQMACPEGMATVGMLDGQASCASTTMKCVDPLSAGCDQANEKSINDPSTCEPNWQPDLNTQCLGADVLQNDGCGNSRMGKGLEPSACAKNACQYSGDLKWGACTLKNVNLNIGPGESATLMNDNKGWIGTYRIDCVGNTPPQASQFGTPAVSCLPVTCKNLATLASWSSLGLKSTGPGVGMDPVGVNGQWDCEGALDILQSAVYATRDLNSVEAEPMAKARAINSASTAESGGLTLTCHDTGDITDRNRDGQLYAEGVSCTPTTTTTTSTTTTTVPPGPNPLVWNQTKAKYFFVGVRGSLAPGDVQITFKPDGTWTSYRQGYIPPGTTLDSGWDTAFRAGYQGNENAKGWEDAYLDLPYERLYDSGSYLSGGTASDYEIMFVSTNEQLYYPNVSSFTGGPLNQWLPLSSSQTVKLHSEHPGADDGRGATDIEIFTVSIRKVGDPTSVQTIELDFRAYAGTWWAK